MVGVVNRLVGSKSSAAVMLDLGILLVIVETFKYYAISTYI